MKVLMALHLHFAYDFTDIKSFWVESLAGLDQISASTRLASAGFLTPAHCLKPLL